MKTLIKNLNVYYSKITDGESLREEWAQRLSTIGQTVKLSFGQTPSENHLVGVAESVTADGGLIIRLPEDSLFTANAGEITLAKSDDLL